MIGVLGGYVQSILFAFATRSSLILLAGSFAFFAGAISPGYRSFFSRLVTKEETARLFSFFSIIMMLYPVLAALIFNNIFNATISTWPGFAFFVASVLQFIVFCVQILLHYLLHEQWKENYCQLDHGFSENQPDCASLPTEQYS
ncbi:unnamed protein product [Gongylonema pulchrum]|uniref:MFS domain-containing protein n=1 Tax=Gongylonema pulchrum TaxID=637853 RepID=A0A183EQ47_9BILA|nr:unnamed protein product [Gongylonema pulchrum]